MSLNQALQSNELNNEQIKKVVGVLESLIIGTAETLTTVEVDLKSQNKPLFGFTSGDDDTPEIMQGVFNDYGWDDDDDDNSGIENDENSFMYKRENTKKEEKKSDSDKKETKSEFVKKAEELKQKMADLGLKAETEIKFNLENWSEISINNNFAWELKKEIKAGWQHPFCFPAVPIFQIRVGFKYSVYFRFSIGLQVTFENKDDTGPELTIKVNIEIGVGAKFDAVAEGGLYTGIVNVYGGLSGTLLDAKLEAKLSIFIIDGFNDFYTDISINALQFRLYVEGEIDLWIWSVKKVLWEETFGLTEPLFTAYYYI